MAAVGLLALSACSSAASESPGSAGSAGPPTSEAAEPQPSESDEPTQDADQDEEQDEELSALTSEQMVDVLIGPADLPGIPDGHSTHSGAEYFHEEIAVEFENYRNRFGPDECAVTMDSINVDLVGEGAEDGLMHMYRLSTAEDQTGTLYVWMLAYDREVNTSPVWHTIGDHCGDTQLANDTDTVDVATFDAGDFTGVRLGIHSEQEEQPQDFTTFSATLDVGENLIMMSSVGLEEDRFREMVETQEHKLAQFNPTED